MQSPHSSPTFSLFNPMFLFSYLKTPCFLFLYFYLMLSLDFKIHERTKTLLSISAAPEAYQPNRHSTCVSFVALSHPNWIYWFDLASLNTNPHTPHEGLCVGSALCSLLKVCGKIIYQHCGCRPAIVVQLMSMLIFIINDGTSGQSACDCGHRRGLQGDLFQ